MRYFSSVYTSVFLLDFADRSFREGRKDSNFMSKGCGVRGFKPKNLSWGGWGGMDIFWRNKKMFTLHECSYI